MCFQLKNMVFVGAKKANDKSSLVQRVDEFLNFALRIDNSKKHQFLY